MHPIKALYLLWKENRKALKSIYNNLPTSVFQADLNPSNILLDETGKFIGVYDFKLCGRDVFLNYLFREMFDLDFKRELDMVVRTLQTVSKYYHFLETEKSAAPMLYGCLKPLWCNKLQRLKEAQDDIDAIKEQLNETERYLTEAIAFSPYMI